VFIPLPNIPLPTSGSSPSQRRGAKRVAGHDVCANGHWHLAVQAQKRAASVTRRLLVLVDFGSERLLALDYTAAATAGVAAAVAVVVAVTAATAAAARAAAAALEACSMPARPR
jgi:hypothetical protein